MAEKHQHLKPKISVSGAADTAHCGDGVLEQGRELGREIIRQGGILVTGATTGFPFWAAKGASEEGGIIIGLSPAASEREHVENYKLPLDFLDINIYTGFGYSGRNMLMTRASDGVIVGCGRIGTINEFTVAFEDGKPVGVLEESGPTGDVIKNMLDKANRPNDKVIFSNDPKKLVEEILKKIDKEKMEYYRVYANSDKFYKNCTDEGCKAIL